MSNKVKHKKKKVRRKYDSNRELLIEFSYIKIENVIYNSSYHSQNVYINLTEKQKDSISSDWWWNGPDVPGIQNRRIYIHSTSSSSPFVDDGKTQLNHFNIGKYKNLITVYNSSMHKICYIDADWTEREDEGKYIIQNKHKMHVYWANEPLDVLIKDCEKQLVKYISRKNNENKQFSKKNFYKSRELSRRYDSRHKQYNKNFMRR